ncbi:MULTISPECIES: efflux RND transporter periplasmic adaptor subunit [unclassified Rhizobium]|uniref:efflux RND transporter periplasmic adaptor subunit n=1 Tax=unclassified Rhizobium TaxID=2613769 RepID=UPI001ADC3565|nr:MULTISPECIES: efflux RND transporter periplasmic adaptor subunit [unclassified Rhizobium]MBO9099212.1 efflux RND transporter periplasmic adaptor subunit [Rhizobium sp. L58/93]MBO9131982.1 efflux RND transporter periplasmic adaptor subunit [Rhizobium sp. B209b/85]MBO9169474.1 efflux RND transporter periplasmic adaptor subunit [Rhizobium sp. L245/93]MBO9185425.1 efflux RND transporter periplasmic adaptor subunit [Rhizobium sp. E27B/91]QXZ85824.1 efflux RND transporter periplasmic adaptor subu
MFRTPLKAQTTAFLLLSLLPAFAASAEETAVAAPKQNLPAIVVTQAVKRNMVEKIVATGTVKAVEEVYIQPLVDGLPIKTLHADVGDKVTAGSTLATLSDDALVLQKAETQATRAKGQATLAQLHAQLIEAQANDAQTELQRARSVAMGEKGTVSVSTVEQATASAAANKARVTSAEQAIAVQEADLKVVDSQIADIDLKLARTGVKTPVSGTVASRNARVGAIANGSGDPLFTIIRDSALELVTDVSESDITKIQAGQKATVSLSGSREKLTGSVRLVSPTVDAVTRLGAVHIYIDDGSKARAGMYGSTEIVINQTDGIALPLTAVNNEPQGSSARRVENGIVKFVSVETGIQDGAYIQIVKGLNAGDEVVAKAGAYVRDGDHITPVHDMPAATN